uniref:Ig-like domain-containing protein n=1 Tax=Malurus cyaneus samueli TaxID=2593467 RepID=A0A8C5T5G4_9PASS
MVLFSPCTISLLSLPGVDMQSAPVQTPELQTRVKGMSASMSCRLGDKTVMHWYRQLPGEPPKRILYVSGGTPVFDDSNDRNKFQARNHPTEPVYGLTINSLTPRDSGIYYYSLCFEPQVVNSAKNSNTSLFYPFHDFLQQERKNNNIMYVCIIEKFYPELIRVTWTDEEKEITDNVVKGDTWQSTKEDEYSIASWLTVPAENKDKKYYCKYEHEEKKDSLEKKAAPRLPIGKI